MMKRPLKAFFALFPLILFAACSTQVENYKSDAESYRALAIQAENRGDFLSAHLGYERVLSNTRLANLGPKAEARNLFHIARMAGYRGLYRKSVYQFNQTLDLIEKASPDPDIDYLKSKTYVELARLYHDTGHHDSAVPYFNLAVEEIEKQNQLNQTPKNFKDYLNHLIEELEKDTPEAYLKRFKTESLKFPDDSSLSFDPLLFAQFLDELSHSMLAADEAPFALVVSAEAQHIREQQTLANDPIAFALFLDDFAESLNATEEPEYAAHIMRQAQAIRDQHPGEQMKEDHLRY